MKTRNYLIYLCLIVGINVLLLFLAIDITFEWCVLFFTWAFLFLLNRNRFSLTTIGGLFMLVEEQPNVDQHPKVTFKINILMILPIIINILIGTFI